MEGLTPEPIYDNGKFVRYRDAGDCPDVDSHTEHPNGYIEFDEWAEEMQKTHVQKRCPSCGFYVIWEKKQ